MPELPEVEVTRLSFADRIRGAGVLAARLGKPLRWPLGREPQALVGHTVAEVTRRGKYLWLEFAAPGAGGLLRAALAWAWSCWAAFAVCWAASSWVQRSHLAMAGR